MSKKGIGKCKQMVLYQLKDRARMQGIAKQPEFEL